MRCLSRAGDWGSTGSPNFPLLLVVAILGGAGYAPAWAAQNAPEGSYRISLDVSLVVLHATVTDQKGRLVSGLRQDDFCIHDQGALQRISVFRHEDAPVTVGLVIDHSGSMKPKLQDVVAAADTFARASNPDDQVFVVNFNERVSMGLPEGVVYASEPAELERAISAAPTRGKTALFDAIARALDRLDNGKHDKKVLIVISDGGDNASTHKLAQITRMAEESDAILYAIGLFDEDDLDSNPKALRSLAEITGGEAFFPKETDAVVGLCERIAKDIRSQYTLGYTPTPAPAAGTRRTIRVEALAPHHGRLSVRTRSGYIAVPRGASDEEGRTGAGK